IYAPTLRYHDGEFYLVTTNVGGEGNFFVHTEDPAGEWSDPVWLDIGGIDPSLCFDEDGTVYLTGQGKGEFGEGGIAQAELDIETGKLLTPWIKIWEGTGGRHPEGPHLYHINNTYYLMIAEGGTEYGHMETIARSDSPWGPFESCPHNPIISHRDRGRHPIQGTGHADLIEDDKGNWWLFFLAFRITGGQYHHLGRETFLAPVEWEDGWPLVNGDGTVELEMDVNRKIAEQEIKNDFRDDFNGDELGLEWNFLRKPIDDNISLQKRTGWLRLYGNKLNLSNPDSPVFVGKRQNDFNCRVEVKLDFEPIKAGEEAGLSVFMNENHHYEIAISKINDNKKIIVRRRIGSLQTVTADEIVEEGSVILKVKADKNKYYFSYEQNNETLLMDDGETRYLSSEVAGGFTGVYLAMYTTGNGEETSVPADFDWFEYSSG
ncbi:MAG: glycoside hydrolase family 43 protein, partial [bacterium]